MSKELKSVHKNYRHLKHQEDQVVIVTKSDLRVMINMVNIAVDNSDPSLATKALVDLKFFIEKLWNRKEPS